jgi:ubiquinone/menaquinone biosynthesis C-methylase UbiE
VDCEPSDPAVHRAAQEGFSREAASYGRGRPEYPQQLVAWLQQALQLGPGGRVVDLGAGTGKFTRLLLQTGASVVAIEPVDAMRAQLLQNFPGVTALAATAQAMPLAEASVDAVVCAQAFHWFASHEALQEIARVLRPGGKLGLVWNVRDESVDWVAELTRIMAPHEGDTPRFHSGDWRRLFPSEKFSQLQETTVAHQHVGKAQAVIVDRVLSVSFIAALPPQARAHVAEQLADLITSHPQLRQQPLIGFPYLTHAFCGTRVGRDT